ncbi:MAG: competence protein ComEC [Actinomycetota bacterium]|nr:competence protein ComEC [Actinomycetota bacterium]
MSSPTDQVDAPAGMSEPLDARLAGPAVAAWVGAFVGTGAPTGRSVGWLVVLSIGMSLMATAVIAGRSGRSALARAVVLVLLCLVAGSTVGGLRLQAVRGSGLAGFARDGATASASGVVTADPVLHRGRTRGDRRFGDLFLVPVRLDRVEVRGRLVRTRAPVLVLATDRRWAALLPGQRLALTGRLGPAETGQPVAAVVSVRGPPVLRGRPPPVQRAAGALRAGLRRATAGLPPDERGLLPGLVVGDTSRMPPELVDDFRAAGLTHLTAVSGANIAILVSVVLVAGRWAGLRGRWLPVAGSLAMAAFVVLARPQPSVLRAAAMGAIALLAMVTGRRRRSLAALAAAALLLLLVDPWLARSYGFVLSVLATGGLVLLAPVWARRWHAGGVPRPLAEALAVPLAAQLVCGPVIVLLSGRLSLVAVPANLLVAPAVAPATVLGVLATAAAPLDGGLARVLATAAGLPVWWVAQVARRAAAVPGSAVGWPGTVSGALLLAAASVAVVLTGRMLSRRPARAAGAAAVLSVALVVPATSPGWPPPGWVLAVCDVGQGDALVLSVTHGTAVVVDAGPDPEAVDRCLRRLGVARVPIVLLTHLHADHVEGLPGVLRGRRVGEVALGSYGEPAEELARVRGWARGSGVPVRSAVVGERMSVGTVSWSVLWPARVIDEDSVPNNASLVLLVRSHGLRLLLTGDVEPPAQRALLARRRLPRVDVLKVAHHGSAYQDPGLLAETRPRLALISVGIDNDYGHPAPATVRALRRSGALVGRTDLDGTLVVVGPPGHLQLVTARG